MKEKKLKILYLYDLFKNKTSESNPIKMPEILDYLDALGIRAERKAIYSDIDALVAWGMDILFTSENPSGYYLASTEFEPIEIKILTDAIASSEFLTKRKSVSLNSRLLTLVNQFDALQIQNQVVLNPKKFKNEHVYYSLDTLQDAIQNNKSIVFKYFDITVNKQKKYRKNEAYYSLIPYALLYENQRYYCIGYSTKHSTFSHYRVDKMDDIQHKESIEKIKFSIATYQKTNFNMSLGHVETVVLEIDSSLISTIYDEFGQDVLIQHITDCTYTLAIKTTLSLSFIGWILQFESKIKVISPQQCIDEITQLCKTMLLQYTSK